MCDVRVIHYHSVAILAKIKTGRFYKH